MFKEIIPYGLLDRKVQEDIFFESGFPIHLSAECLLVASLFSKMLAGKEVVLDSPVDIKLLKNIEKLQNIWVGWFPEFQSIDLSSLKTCESQTEESGDFVGVFFTGGVDSFYSYLKHRDEVTHIIYVQGFDLDYKDSVLLSSVSETLKKIANEFDVELIQVRTNLRDYFNESLEWGKHAHGEALATVGLLLKNSFSKIYIASSFFKETLFSCWGSHPDIDSLWSTGSLKFVHDGLEVNRLEKVGSIIKSPVALNYLRVCYTNKKSLYNCCRCEKCVRTMVSLDAFGVLGECASFPEEITKAKVKKIVVVNNVVRDFLEENIAYLKQNRPSYPYLKELEEALEGPSFRAKCSLFYKKKKLRLVSICQYYLDKFFH